MILVSLNLYKTTYLKVDNVTQESVLDVASRWSHVKIIEFLANNIDWPNNLLKKAILNSSNELITKILKSKVKKNRKDYCFGICGRERPYLKDLKVPRIQGFN